VGRIVVGVDSSDGAKRALEWAVGEARLRGATVEAVHVWQLPYFLSTPLGDVPLDRGDLQDSAQSELDGVVEAIDASGLSEPVTRTVAAGNPAGVLIDIAGGADLLVVGARGHGGFSGLLLGSVSHQVANHAPCPVVIVPHE
jgi:nucleotide-binding universal stress UspA family protein